MRSRILMTLSFFFTDTATTEIYTLSLHDALPISAPVDPRAVATQQALQAAGGGSTTSGGLRSGCALYQDRKSTRLNSSHMSISYAVFCLKKKNYPSATPPPNSRQKPLSERSSSTP